MNWINTLNPLQWLLLAAIPPAIFSLYFLKLKRREAVVSSTLLWRRAIEDLHVNSLWQRLRNNLLLILQLLVVGLIILACLRPGWSGMNRVGERRIYLVDNSASMGANDESPTRLEAAQAKLRELIADTASDDVGMVIAFSDRADVLQGFTNDSRRLRNAVDSIELTSRATDAREALRAAAGLANPGRTSFEENKDIQVAEAVPATVYMLTDGAIGNLGETDYGQLKIEYIPIGKEGTSNVAIVGFALERDEDDRDRLEAFARILNAGAELATGTASLYLDDRLIDASAFSIPPGQETGLTFELQGLERGRLKLELDIDDSLTVDNVAFASARPSRQISVLVVTAGNTALEKALLTARIQQIASVSIEPPSFLETPEFRQRASQSLCDLIVFDGCSPKQMPDSNTLFLGSLPPTEVSPSLSADVPPATTGDVSPSPIGVSPSPTVGAEAGWRFGPPVSPVLILDVNRTNPITQYLEMAAVNIIESRTVTPPVNGTVLMTSDSGPVFAVAPRGPFQDAVLGFDLVRPTPEGFEMNTDWGIKRSFPVFVYAAIEHLGGGITQASAPSVQPGMPIQLTLSNRFTTYEIVDPLGRSMTIDRGPDGRFVYTRTEVPGVYEVRAPGLDPPVEVFCVNLFSTRESDLAIVPAIDTGAEKIAANQTTIRARQELWRWLLVLGLGVLMAEWILFNKRIFV